MANRLKHYNKSNQPRLHSYKIFGTDIYSDFIYKKKFTSILYNKLINLKLSKSESISTNFNNSDIKLESQNNFLLRNLFVKPVDNFLSTNRNYNVTYLYSMYGKKFKLFFNNISSQYIKRLCLLNKRVYKYNFISFLML
jgi:hypothetical protein